MKQLWILAGANGSGKSTFFDQRLKKYNLPFINAVIHLNLATLNKARVIQRVNSGGHNVPEEKIESRIPRTLKNIKLAIQLCDNIQMLDNSSSENPYRVILTFKNQNIIFKTDPLPDWAKIIIS